MSDDFPWNETSRILQCQGCDTVSFRRDDFHEINGVEVRYYPAAAYRPKPQWMDTVEFVTSCPPQIWEIYREAYINLQNQCCASAAMCARAILELTMIDKVGDHRSFNKNLDAFEKGGFMLPAQREAIEAALDSGSAVIHRGYQPNELELDVLLFQIEAILALVYLKSNHIATLTKRVPPKAKRSDSED